MLSVEAGSGNLIKAIAFPTYVMRFFFCGMFYMSKLINSDVIFSDAKKIICIELPEKSYAIRKTYAIRKKMVTNILLNWGAYMKTTYYFKIRYS